MVAFPALAMVMMSSTNYLGCGKGINNEINDCTFTINHEKGELSGMRWVLEGDGV